MRRDEVSRYYDSEVPVIRPCYMMALITDRECVYHVTVTSFLMPVQFSYSQLAVVVSA